ncbi:M16 family metallopeptidase [Lacimicrobium alkaliphilum]|uniref:Peptidase M16 n=1 Tax=Lacimicrobium alkaliphilum TaxID=1526571 RepID=A0A0U2JJB2_9ALTE|nr:pitrilysin family protein [Lacimicrobium alkaliphilum]ALS99206.1 peptidase M16 [Lacimicrobium alkaliphilum]
MPFKPLLLLSCLFTLVACVQSPLPATSPILPEGVTLIEQHTPQEGETGIAYKKYQLDNGLTVVLHADDSDPLVHVDVTYYVGSAREELGKSGFAHFFEHMMFQGSENVEDEQHFKMITEAGGNLNGTTNSDRTNYYQTVPANQLEKVLWLEADRMGFLLPAVTQQKFEVQRETVKNERAQRVDNQPYGLRSEKTAEALYPAGHPYSWPVIGYTEDLDRVGVDDLKAFFDRWYGPNNAVLTIGGDIDEARTLIWVEKYFGSIPRGPQVDKMDKQPVSLAEDRYLTIEDNVHLPLLQVTLPTVHVRHEDEAPLDVLSDILGGGKNSLFYKNLVKDGYAVNAVVGHPCQELACEFQLIALAHPQRTANLSELKQRIDATLAEFEQRGVQPDDLTRVKASILSSTIFGLQSVSGKVSTLAINETFEGKPDLVQYDLARYRAVTANDVMRVYERYIKDKAAVVLSIVPQGQTALAAAEHNFSITRPDVSVESQQAPEWQPPQDDFDRSKEPEAGPAPLISLPEYWQSKFENGMVLVGHSNDETPTVTLNLSLEGGPLLDPLDKAGLASITAMMMNESTHKYSTEEIANELAKLGSAISFSASGRYTQITLSSLTENLDQTLELLKEKLFNPAFLEQDFERIRQQLLQSLQQQVKRPEALASRAVRQLLMGSDNRLGLPDSGTLASIQALKLEDIKAFYQQYYSPAISKLVLVGDIGQADALQALDFLRQWQGQDYQLPQVADFAIEAQPRLYLVDHPGSAQSVIRIVKPDLPYDATGEQFRSKLMNFPLGGMFNSRINLNLREDKGYTYGASSRFVGGKTLGWFQAGASVKLENTGDALREFLTEIDTYQQHGLTAEELSSLRLAYLQGEALDYETPAQKARFLRHLLTFDLPADYVREQQQIIRTIGLAELNQLSREKLKAEQMQIIVVGDKAQILEQLAGTDREIVELTLSL